MIRLLILRITPIAPPGVPAANDDQMEPVVEPPKDEPTNDGE